jgi:plastocyanin
MPTPAARSFTSRQGLEPRLARSTLRSGSARALLTIVAALCAPAAQAVPWAVQVRNAAGHPVADAVIAVELNAQPAKAPAQTSAQVVQRERQFRPYVLVIQTGTAVSFPNFDTVRHHVYSFSPTKTFDIKLYAGTPARPEIFDQPGVATLGCNIHDRMSAHIVVVDTPLFGKTDAQGLLRIDVPPGHHRLLYWHPKLEASLRSQPVTVDKDGSALELALDFAD